MDPSADRDAETRVAKAVTEKSRAEVLCAMDCLMHHLNDEYAIEPWLENGVPDGMPWNVLEADADRFADYLGLAQEMSDEEFEDMVKLFAQTVRQECFSVKYQYQKRAFG